MKFWLARGIDGFRLDAVRYFIENAADAGQQDQPETHAFLKRIRAKLQTDYPDALLVAEAWAPQDIVAHLLRRRRRGAARASRSTRPTRSRPRWWRATRATSSTPWRPTDALLAGKDRGYDAPFLSNHDQPRVMRVLGNDAGRGTGAAAAILFALPGTPFVYYGEELGMQGGAGSDDRNKRTPYPWDAGTGHGFTTGVPWVNVPELPGVDLHQRAADPGSLFHLYRKLIALRHGQTPLSKGSVTRPTLSGAPPGVMALLREDGSKRVLFVANVGTVDSGAFDVQVTGTPSVLLQEGLGGAPTAGSGSLSVPGLGPRGFVFLSL